MAESSSSHEIIGLSDAALFNETRNDLDKLFIDVGVRKLGWKLKKTELKTIVFKTPWNIRSIGETVTVDYMGDSIRISSETNQHGVYTSWGKNSDNCSRFLKLIVPDVKRYLLNKEKERLLAEEKEEKERINEKAILKAYYDSIMSELDKDGNGIVDDIEDNDDFNLLLKKHQKNIVEINRNYVKEFVKISNYLKTKKRNIQLIFNSLKDTSSKEQVDDFVGILKNEIHSYKVILYNSLNMIVSLIEDDMITFYEIHDSFDKLNMFNSNWENEVSQKLSNIGYGLDNLMYSINEMGQNIIQEIGNLSYVTEQSNQMLTNKLQEVDSSIQVNNLLTSIQTYQMYKVNKNTRSLR